MTAAEIYRQFIQGLHDTTVWEFIAVAFGILSVIFSRMENIWVYPTGLVNTILFTWFCFSWWGLYAEASLNLYYSIMSIYGWILWSRQRGGATKLQISRSSRRDWTWALAFFLGWWVLLYITLSQTKSTVPMADSFASATAYTAMWLMARKKLEHWLWWILTNLASIPLYFYKMAVFTSVQYLVFLILAIMGYITWRKNYNAQKQGAL